MLTGVISTFGTGTYTVTRTTSGALTVGVYEAGVESTFDIAASVQPVTGRKLQVLPEGRSAEESRILYTTTELRTQQNSNDPDIVTIDDEPYLCISWERWQFGLWSTHYEVVVARQLSP